MKKTSLFFCYLILPLMALWVIFNWHYLTVRLWIQSFRFNAPKIAVQNNRGDMALLDSDYNRIVTMQNGVFTGIIKASDSSTKNTIRFTDIAVGDGKLFIIERPENILDSQIYGWNISSCNLDGSDKITLYKHYHDNEQTGMLPSSLSVTTNTVYCCCVRENEVIVLQITHHGINEILRQKCEGNPPRLARYSPRENCVYFLASSGELCSIKANEKQKIIFSNPDWHISGFCFTKDGDTIICDGNQNGIFKIEQDGSAQKLTACAGGQVIVVDRKLLYCDPKRDSIHELTLATHSRRIYSEAMFSTKFKLFRLITFITTGFLLVALIVLSMNIISKFVTSFKQHQKQFIQNIPQNAFSLKNLYGRTLLVLLFALLTATGTISVSTFNVFTAQTKRITRSVSSVMSRNSAYFMGNALKDINSANDFRSQRYAICAAICANTTLAGNPDGFNVNCSLYRLLDNGKVMQVIDWLQSEHIGKILSPLWDKDDNFFSAMETVRKGEIACVVNPLSDLGSSYTYYFAPVFDTANHVIGCMELNYNRGRFLQQIIMHILSTTLDLTLIFILGTFLLGEAKLILEFIKVKWQNKAQGILTRTVVEGHRTMLFFHSVTVNLGMGFFAFLFADIARKSGFESKNIDFLAGLPLSVDVLVMLCIQTYCCILAQKHPRRFLLSGIILTVFAFNALVIAAIYLNNYWLLLVAFFMSGIGRSFQFAATSVIRASRIPVHEQFKHLVFVNTEYTLGEALAFIGGGLIYVRFGAITVLTVTILIGIIQMILASVFIKNDFHDTKGTSVPTNIQQQHTHERLKKYWKFLKHPQVLAFIAFSIIPAGILSVISCYTFPIYNEKMGYSALVTGCVVTVANIIAILVVSFVLAPLRCFAKRTTVYLAIAASTVSLFLLGVQTGLFSFFLVMITAVVFSILGKNYKERAFIPHLEKLGLKLDDVDGLFEAASSIGATAGAPVLGLLMAQGFQAFGYISAAALLAALILFGIICAFNRKKDINPAQGDE